MSKQITKLTSTDLKDIKILAFDGDGVTMPEGTHLKEKDNELIIHTQSPQGNTLVALKELKNRFKLLFTSGRSLLFLTRMYEPLLWENIILQGEMGIFSLVNGQVHQLKPFTPEQLTKSNTIKKKIRQLSKTDDNIVGFEPKQLLITVHCQQKDEQIENLVKENDPENKYHCVWSGEAYDIGPKEFNKGTGLNFLLNKMNLKPENVLAVGNDPNDIELMETAGLSITTNPETLPYETDFVTSKTQHEGGRELINHLLNLL
jgi:hypothetical protein